MDDVVVDVIAQRYPDEWVLVEVTRSGPSRQSLRGRVLAHGPSQESLGPAYRRFRRSNPLAEVYEFFTGSPVEEGVVAVL